MKKINKVGAVSLGKVLGIMYAIMGAAFGLMITVLSLLGNALFAESSNSVLVFGLVAVVVFPIIYGVLGFLFGALAGWIFNLAAKWAGGLEIELEESASLDKSAN